MPSILFSERIYSISSMDQNYYNIFYKIIEDPRCIKYYKDLIQYYKSKNKENFAEAIELLIKNIEND